MQIDFYSFLIGLPIGAFLIFLILKAGQRKSPYLPYSHLTYFSTHSGKKALSASLTFWLFVLAALLFFIAFLDPALVKKKKVAASASVEGRALYFALDQSSSMKSTQGPSLTTKIDLLKKVTQNFIEDRPQDLMGLISFARAAHMLSPLTLNHDELLSKLKKLDVVTKREDDGTAIGYAIYKTASVLAATRNFGEEERKKGYPSYNIQGAAIILVTDGFQFPNPGDKGKRLRTMGIEEAAEYAKQQRVRLYIINIDPHILSDEVAPQRRLMQRAAELTGGQFFAAPDAKTLSQIFDSLDKLEVSTLPLPAKQIEVRLFSFFPYLIIAGLLMITLAILHETLYIRSVP